MSTEKIHQLEVPMRWGKGALDLSKKNLPSLKALRALESLKSIRARARVLDYGCGEGKMLNTIHECMPQLSLFGMDIQSPLDSSNFEFQLIEVGMKSPSDGSFDAILALDVIEHVQEPRQVLAEIQQLLTADGRFVLFVPLEGELLSPYTLFRLLIGRDLYKITKQHFQSFNERDFLVLVRQYFEIETISYSYHFLGTLMDSLFFALCRIPAIGKWWWRSNSIYNPAEDGKKGLLNRILEFGNWLSFNESQFLKDCSMFSTGIHILARPKSK
jgi:2-polyprenyl-3-methyl-5-hydroxy-6-metoxy-1,4-benzoquinol methylase